MGAPWKTGPMATLASTVFHGSSASAWNMKLVPPVIPVTGWPPTRTWPALGRSSPATMVSVVDLPQPVGPTTAQNCPGRTTRSTSRRAVKAVPAGVRKRLLTPASSIPASWIRRSRAPGPGGPPAAAAGPAPADLPLATLVK